MLNITTVLGTLLCLASALRHQLPRRIQNANHHKRVPGEYLVVLKSRNTDTDVGEYVNNVVEKIKALEDNLNVIRFSAFNLPMLHIRAADDKTVNALFDLPEVELIEADVIETITKQCSNQDSGSSLWGLTRISSRDSPNYSTGKYSYINYGGHGVRVYVLDTGIRITQSEFYGRAEWGSNMLGGVDVDGNGHGTHCAGIVAGHTYGGAKGATVVAVKVVEDNLQASTLNIIRGINWSIQDMVGRLGRGVISLSWAASRSSAIDSAVAAAEAAGIPTVAAAGNENQNACNLSPGRSRKAIVVGATNIQDSLASYSNWGECVDILAPGSSILSASHRNDSASSVRSGTSMATPLVAAVVANYLSDNPTASPAQVRSYLSARASKDRINLRGTTTTPNLLLYATC